MSGSRFVAIFLSLVAAVVAAAMGLVALAGQGYLGRHEPAGRIVGPARSPAQVQASRRAQSEASDRVGVPRPKQILFGDFHVHTTFSFDAFVLSLPGMIGEGAHPPADACDFARHCSALDFFSVTDHAEGMTPLHWRETLDALRSCRDVAGTTGDPDLVPFAGWEWTQAGSTPDEHFGHKNVVLAGLEPEEVPARPIAATGPDLVGLPGPLARGLLGFRSRHPRFHDFSTFVAERAELARCADDVDARELPSDCSEVAETPADLFRKLDEWDLPAIVIPHGTTWGASTPPGATLDRQLLGSMHDPGRQSLFEISSGLGDGEVHRSFRALMWDENDEPSCPAPTADHLPTCWRAGEIVRERCLREALPAPECEERARTTRAHAAAAGSRSTQVIDGASAADWLDAGQCRDCDQPTFDYRPGGSAQALLALGGFDAGGEAPRRFRVGFIASSGNHSARPGTGYKERARVGMTDSVLPDGRPGSRIFLPADDAEPGAASRGVEPGPADGPASLGSERQASFFQTGGLVAVHAAGRSREDIWEAVQRREVYATSGPRILLWFDLLNAPGRNGRGLPMGSEVAMARNPIFQVRAVGSFEQRDGCPEDAYRALGPDRVARLCHGECHHPGETRRLITRIEVVRIRPQITPDEDLKSLIDDPWKTFSCAPDLAGCAVTFEDTEFLSGGRESVYYVRAYESSTLGINAGRLRCTWDDEGRCVAVHPCGQAGRADDCLDTVEPRAWSSPLYLDFAGRRPAAGTPGLAARTGP